MPSEHAIQSAIMLYLATVPEVYAWRNNTGTLKNERGVPISFGQPGSADILACVRGKFVAIEVKSWTGRQSEEQRLWEASVRRAKGVYILARSVDDVRVVVSNL